MTDKKRPDIVDNIDANMADVLNLNIPDVQKLDVSTGYFELSGYGMVQDTIQEAVNRNDFTFRLLLGLDAINPPSLDTFEDYKKRIESGADSETKSVREDIDGQEFNGKNMNATTGLISLLRRNNAHVRSNDRKFNHSKCYILGKNLALVGSSNFTQSGFCGNHELNAAIYQPASLEKIDGWFERMWNNAKDTKDELVELLEQSKFGIPPAPYDIYIKMLFEKYRHILEAMAETDSSKLAHLAKFQKDAVVTATKIINIHRGVIIADSTGLGKTHIGLEIIRQKRFMENKKILLIAPSQVLKTVWHEKLEESGIRIKEISMESLGREEFEDEVYKYAKYEAVVIDESQNFRSRNANRRLNLMKLMSVGRRKEAILLSATPINNSIMDLYYQTSIITNGDDSYFTDIGIPNLYEYMRKVAKEGIETGLGKMQQLLDQIMVRRTRSFIKQVYPDEKLNGKPVKFPKREYKPICYNLVDAVGTDVYAKLLDTVERLHMVPYGIEMYNTTLNDEEKKKHKVRAHLQVILLLKRFESSTYAAKISIDNKIKLYEYFHEILENNAIMSVKDLNHIIEKLNRMDGDPEDISDDREEFFIDEIKKLPTEQIDNYDVENMKKHLKDDLKMLKEYRDDVNEILEFDKKTDAVSEMIMRDGALKTESKKVLIFTEYTATAKHLKKYMESKFHDKNVLLITGDVKSKARQVMIKQFSPRANTTEDEEMPEMQADILISTEVLSEGQNLQDCNYVINYDLPWNPMRIVQRMGRIDRLTSNFDVVHSRECFPDESLDKLLKLVGNLIEKIGTIDSAIGLDAGILGEEANPKQFNGTTAKKLRIFAGKEGDVGSTAEQLEKDSDMMPAVSPLNEINQYVKKTGIERMMEIPMGRRSGKKGSGNTAVVSYIQEKPTRVFYAVLFDYKTRQARMIDDLDAFKMISCMEDTQKHMPMDISDYGKSFEHLLYIDGTARKAIFQKRESDTNTANLLRQTSNRHTKNMDRIMTIIADASASISDEQGNEVFRVLDSPDLRAWEDNVANMLRDYDKSCNVSVLADEIAKMGKKIGIQENESVQDLEDPIVSNLKLVGAMFITDDSFDSQISISQI